LNLPVAKLRFTISVLEISERNLTITLGMEKYNVFRNRSSKKFLQLLCVNIDKAHFPI
jgi:hypothetical protein